MTDQRAAFAAAADMLVDLARRIPADAWDKPGLGEWTVRDLAGHAGRSLTTVEEYLARSAERVDVPTTVAYFELIGTVPDADVAERGRAAGRALGDDPATTLAEQAGRAMVSVSEARTNALVGTIMGGMRLADYLPTRIFELTVHSLDLAAATGLDVDPPRAALEASLQIVAELAVRPGLAAPLLLAVTGRGPLPPGFSVLHP
jgi:uncharacterized protein (TIGR03083 family)